MFFAPGHSATIFTSCIGWPQYGPLAAPLVLLRHVWLKPGAKLYPLDADGAGQKHMPLKPMRSVAGAASITPYRTAIANVLSFRLLELRLCNMVENSLESTDDERVVGRFSIVKS